MYRKILLAFTVAIGLVSTLTATAHAQNSSSTSAGEVKVTVTGVRNGRGRLRVEVWNKADGFPKKNENALKFVWIDASSAVNGTVTTTFSGLAPGVYAFSTMHDENSNGKLDTNMVGMPKEGWATSSKTVSRMHPPTFEESKVEVPADGTIVTLALHY